ncbi:MAG: metal ABC transporter substrate-binding protein [Ilumatobacteraceae bacterium]
MHRRLNSRTTFWLAAAMLALGACGSGDGSPPRSTPEIVATTSILADVVGELVGDQASVVTVMPNGADPHDFQPSAQQIAQLRDAGAVIANGGGFEGGLAATLDSARRDGIPVFSAIDVVDTRPLGDAIDPHFFTDPARMAVAARAMSAFITEQLPTIDADAVAARTSAYIEQLDGLDAEIAGMVDALDPAQRTLVTNHEVFGYFADRYGFDVLGVIVPGGGTAAEPSASGLDALAESIRLAGVPAIFVDVSSPDRLAESLAAEVGEVQVVSLYSESLGEPGSGADTYLGMMRTDARRIVDALGAG